MESIVARLTTKSSSRKINTSLNAKMMELVKQAPILTESDKETIATCLKCSWDEMLLTLNERTIVKLQELVDEHNNSWSVRYNNWKKGFWSSLQCGVETQTIDQHPYEKLIQLHSLKIQLRELITDDPFNFPPDTNMYNEACMLLGQHVEDLVMKNYAGVRQQAFVRPIPGTDWYLSGMVDGYCNGVITEFKTRRNCLKEHVPKYEKCQMGLYMWMSHIYRGNEANMAILEQHYEQGIRTTFTWEELQEDTEAHVDALKGLCIYMDDMIKKLEE
jgi:hypothetical protein